MKTGLIIGIVIVILILGIGGFFLIRSTLDTVPGPDEGTKAEMDARAAGEDGLPSDNLVDMTNEEVKKEIDNLFGEPVEWDQDMGEDCITDNVCLDKLESGGMFNSVTESSEDRSVSPAGTEWAAGSCESAIIFEVLFQAANERYGVNLVAEGGYCIHLIEDDLYFDVQFLTWGKSIHSYVRVPYAN